jgi:hypothetical protein
MKNILIIVAVIAGVVIYIHHNSVASPSTGATQSATDPVTPESNPISQAVNFFRSHPGGRGRMVN